MTSRRSQPELLEDVDFDRAAQAPRSGRVAHTKRQVTVNHRTRHGTRVGKNAPHLDDETFGELCSVALSSSHNRRRLCTSTV